MLKVGIFGATGYAGEQLIALLLKHPEVKISYLAAEIDKPQPISEFFPHFRNRLELICELPNIEKAMETCELFFLALPHTVSMKYAPQLLRKDKKIIDLSADYRFKKIKIYEKFYKVFHKDKENIKKAVYGLPELYRAEIKRASLVANPGCYPTAVILGLAPLVSCTQIEPDSIIVDAKSGFSGAGRNFSPKEIEGNFKAYKVGVHQHTPEMEEILSKLKGEKIKITFVPHLLPLERGILTTIYVKKAPSQKRKTQSLINLYKRFYKKEPFIRILEEGNFPQLKNVLYTNFCEIGIKEDTKTIIVIVAIDNLIKGASGQAVENMNIMYNFPEDLGLV